MTTCQQVCRRKKQEEYRKILRTAVHLKEITEILYIVVKNIINAMKIKLNKWPTTICIKKNNKLNDSQ